MSEAPQRTQAVGADNEESALTPFLGRQPTGELDYAPLLSTLLTFFSKGILKIWMSLGSCIDSPNV